MKLHTLALAASLVVSGAASANSPLNLNLSDSTNLGNFGAPVTWSQSFSVSETGTIDHSLSFTITENLYAGSGVFNIPLDVNFGAFTMTIYDIDGLNAKIFDSGNNLYAKFEPASVGDTNHLTLLQEDSYFAMGTYTLKIGGTATGDNGAMYTIGAVTAPVPEPETWGMLLAGVGLIGLRMRQRIRASRQAAIN